MNTAIAFIIISYHPEKKELQELIATLTGFFVIVVDNGGTLTFDDVGKATLLSQSSNVGYASAANIGIHHASGFGATWFVMLNQDVKCTRKSILSLTRKLRVLPPSVAGPFPGGLDPKRWTTILPAESVDYLTGSIVAIHEKVIGKVGYFYEPYFLYYEDADYSVRAKLAGFPLVRISLEHVNHEETRSLGKGSFTHQYYLSRNHLLFVFRLAPRMVKLHELVRLPKTISEHIRRKEHGALTGIRDFLLRKGGAWS